MRSPLMHVHAYVAPRSDVERMLAEIWREALGVGQMGVTDNFFELGGRSLMAMRVVGRIRTRWAVPLTARDVFEHPTVAQLAERLETTGRASQPSSEIVAIRRGAGSTSSAGERIDRLSPNARHATHLDASHES